eukprot:COSAG01_NODE_487_length_16389_cov_19.482014_12_plen_65_part_00
MGVCVPTEITKAPILVALQQKLSRCEQQLTAAGTTCNRSGGRAGWGRRAAFRYTYTLHLGRTII